MQLRGNELILREHYLFYVFLNSTLIPKTVRRKSVFKASVPDKPYPIPSAKNKHDYKRLCAARQRRLQTFSNDDVTRNCRAGGRLSRNSLSPSPHPTYTHSANDNVFIKSFFIAPPFHEYLTLRAFLRFAASTLHKLSLRLKNSRIKSPLAVARGPSLI